MRSTLKKPPPCEPRSHTWFPGPNPMALLVIEEQISSPQAIHLHVLQLPKDWVTLQYMHYHSHIPGECGRMGPTRAISHCHLQHHGIFLHWDLIDPFPNICQCIRQPCIENLWVPSSGVYSPCSSGEYISPESLHLSESITGAQQL